MSNTDRWFLAQRRVIDLTGFCIFGVLNVTPDSFYDVGRFSSLEQAVAHGEELLAQGADVLDVGGESTRPFSERVDLQTELNRVCPVVRDIVDHLPQSIVSVDTYKAEVARQALEKGALIVNDVSACRFDPALLDILSQYKPGYVLMHSLGRPEVMQRSPQYGDVVGEIKAFFEERLTVLTRAGLPEENIVLDPGIGFGKLLEHNLVILRHIERFYELGRPLLIGLSNKSMWEKMLGLGIDERQNVTQVATALLAARGVKIHRVHEVALTVQTLKVVQEFLDGE